MKRLLTSSMTILGVFLPATVLAVSNYSIPNPLSSNANNIGDVIQLVSNGLLQIAIPVAVIMIVWAGFNLLASRGDPSKVQRGKDILKWTVIGLAIIFLSNGLVDFIRSILGG